MGLTEKDKEIQELRKRLAELDKKAEVDTSMFDIEEIYPNCTVQVLKNSITGEISVGWWEN